MKAKNNAIYWQVSERASRTSALGLSLSSLLLSLKISGVDSIDFLYSKLGEEGIARMVAAFYLRVRQDALIGPMYPSDDWEGSEERLRDFLIGRFGGPPRYLEKRGHPRLKMRHFPFSIGIVERDRWLELMNEAMIEAQIPEDCLMELRAFFAQVADFLRNRPEISSSEN